MKRSVELFDFPTLHAMLRSFQEISGVHVDTYIAGKTFVLFQQFGRHSDADFLGFVQEVQGQQLQIFLINRQQSITTERRKCTPVHTREIQGGLKGIHGHHPEFGTGIIVAEEFFRCTESPSDRLLYVVLGSRVNEIHSGFVPLDEVVLTDRRQ